MNTQTVANRLYALCEQGDYQQALEELYADHARHIEAMEMPGMDKVTEGKLALIRKSHEWMENNEVHGGTISKPFVNDNQFVCEMTIDITPKVGPMAGKRMNEKEICLYTVEGGKITEAKFFYDTGGTEDSTE
jgi:ketosteroid isomerase-like protein